MATLSPMMQQYMRLKEQNPDTLLFFRVGDFYEMFFDDALTASRELELTLTGKDCGLEERAPMCGVPYHAVDTYVARLVEKGYRVAIGEQMTDPALAKGLVDRDVIRIITPGTLTDTAVIGERKNNFLCSLYVQGKRAGLAACDVSTGEFYAQQLPAEQSAVKAALPPWSRGRSSPTIWNSPRGAPPWFRDFSPPPPSKARTPGRRCFPISASTRSSPWGWIPPWPRRPAPPAR